MFVGTSNKMQQPIQLIEFGQQNRNALKNINMEVCQPISQITQCVKKETGDNTDARLQAELIEQQAQQRKQQKEQQIKKIQQGISQRARDLQRDIIEQQQAEIDQKESSRRRILDRKNIDYRDHNMKYFQGKKNTEISIKKQDKQQKKKLQNLMETKPQFSTQEYSPQKLSVSPQRQTNSPQILKVSPYKQEALKENIDILNLKGKVQLNQEEIYELQPNVDIIIPVLKNDMDDDEDCYEVDKVFDCFNPDDTVLKYSALRMHLNNYSKDFKHN